jgi:hypothetical protein
MTIRTPWYLAAALLAITVPALAATEAEEKSPVQALTGSTTTRPTDGTATRITAAGGVQSLSPGNQKIARALFDAQHPAAGGPTPLTLDQIAALKATEGWGKVFRQMKTEGLIQAHNLGQVVSAAEHARHLARHETHHAGHANHAWAGGTPGRSQIVMTNGAGRSVSVATHGGWRTGGRFAHAGGHHSTMIASARLTTAAGSSVIAGGVGHGGNSSHGGGHGR